MPARIVERNHTVISFKLNGRIQHIVERVRNINSLERVVLDACWVTHSTDWAEITNYLDEWLESLPNHERKQAEKYINKYTTWK